MRRRFPKLSTKYADTSGTASFGIMGFKSSGIVYM